VGEFAYPRTVVVAGDGFRLHPMVLLAHRVVWPDEHSVMIDTVVGPAGTQRLPGGRIDLAAFERVERAMKKASAIVFTHEHFDHVGGVAAAPDVAAIARQVLMTREQVASPRLERGDFAAGALEQLRPLDYQGLATIAPGVVLQKAPGHSPGSQLVYVELANGQRFLFVGDIAWSRDNVTLGRGRPYLARLLMGEDRAGVAAQLRAIAQLPDDVHVIIAHDPSALAQDLAAGLYRQGFSSL
jgi:glyoxylase-like metal-dependent hydrolase (beta-lactamase superfamily II)